MIPCRFFHDPLEKHQRGSLVWLRGDYCFQDLAFVTPMREGAIFRLIPVVAESGRVAAYRVIEDRSDREQAALTRADW
jgi:hypothetical protein